MKKIGIAAIVSAVLGIILLITSCSILAAAGIKGDFLQGGEEEEKLQSESASLDGIAELDLELSGAEITIASDRNASDLTADVSYKRLFGTQIRPRISIEKDGQTLEISLKNRQLIGFGMGAIVKIVIPSSYSGEVRLKANGSSVSLSGLSNISALDLTANGASISGNDAALTGKLELDMNAGKADLQFQKLGGDIDLKMNAGDLNLLLPEDSAFSIDQRKINAGSFDSDFRSVKDSEYEISVEVNAGSVSLKSY